MKQRKAMSRGTGFARKVYVPAPPAPPVRGRGGVLAICSEGSAAAAKSEPKRNAHLLSMARGQRCLLRVSGVCVGGFETTVACHSNLSIHGKAGARKADDCFSCAGCYACHRWLDQGPADASIKELTFMRAHLDQVGVWRAIVADGSRPPKDRAAAHWALTHLNASPVGGDA